jgi:FixJ family two-component response regulator
MTAHHIFLVEDDAPLRTSLTRLLEVSGYSVTGFGSAEAMLTALASSGLVMHPDCIVLDVNLPGLNGVDAQQQLRYIQVTCPVIFVSAELNAHHVNTAWRDGAAEFIFKPFQPQDLLNAIRGALEKKAIDSSLSLSDANTHLSDPIAAKQAKLIQGLTPRQQQVLLWLVDGHSNTQIAEKMDISARTVKMHREGLMQRLEIKHITELARIYQQCKHLLKS